MAGFNVNSFKSTVSKSGVLQTNKFIVGFVSPEIMQNSSIGNKPTSQTEQLIQVRAESVKVPGIAIVSTDVNRYGVGPTQKMPYNATFTSNSITFISDKEGEIYKYFYTWLNKIFDFSGSTGTGGNRNASYKTEYKDKYTTDLHVMIYDNYGKLIKDVVMYKAFPESMNDVSLGWNDNNTLFKITVTFSFRDWAMKDVTTSQNGTTTIPTSSVPQTLAANPNPTPIVTSTPKATGLPDFGKFNQNSPV